MAQVSGVEIRRKAHMCPEHGKTHVQSLIVPDAGDYFPAFYTCAICAPSEAERRSVRPEITHGDITITPTGIVPRKLR